MYKMSTSNGLRAFIYNTNMTQYKLQYLHSHQYSDALVAAVNAPPPSCKGLYQDGHKTRRMEVAT